MQVTTLTAPDVPPGLWGGDGWLADMESARSDEAIGCDEWPDASGRRPGSLPMTLWVWMVVSMVVASRLAVKSSRRGVKWSAAVGAATAPFSRANIVW